MKKKIYYSLISLMILNMIGQTILLFYYNGNLLNFLSLALSGFVIVIYIALFSNKLYSDKPVCKKCKNTGIIKNNLYVS